MAFYRSLGLQVAEQPHVVSVYAGDQMINFHRPSTWQRDGFTLRAPNASRRAVISASCGADSRGAGRDARRRGPPSSRARWSGKAAPTDASSVYVRDPDGNLLEFMIYP